jgi:hypothetical protein
MRRRRINVFPSGENIPLVRRTNFTAEQLHSPKANFTATQSPWGRLCFIVVEPFCEKYNTSYELYNIFAAKTIKYFDLKPHSLDDNQPTGLVLRNFRVVG